LVKSRLAKWILRRGGFELVGRRPEAEHTVMIAYPHTSNWDFPIALLIGWALELNMRWLGKKEMFPPVIGALWRRLGGIPVDRSSAGSIVEDLTELFNPGERITITVPVSGTRGHTPHWKSGFYRIARAANVPVVPAFVDYTAKTCGAGEPIELTGDVSADMDLFREFYAGIEGKHPENDGPIVMREELEGVSESDNTRGE
jgi:1-acyl-sn-glycerol-3-phosphate acyltransferase